MKIAISSQGSTIESLVDPRFGRSNYFILFDTYTGEYTCYSNEHNWNAVQGAGIQTAKNLVDLGSHAVVTGNLGPKAFSVLQTKNIAMYNCEKGTVRESLEQAQWGHLQPITKPSMESQGM